MNKMDFFLRDHNLNSTIIYLLLSLGLILFTLCVSVLLGKVADKKDKATEKKNVDNKNEVDAEWLCFVVNHIWKGKLKQYRAYKILPYFIAFYILMNVVSFISRGRIFSNPFIRIFYDVYWIFLAAFVLDTYYFIKGKKEWLFEQDKQSLTFTDKFVLENKSKIQMVVNSKDDASLSFLSGKQTVEDGRIVALEEIIKKAPVYSAMHVLPEGFAAIKKGKKWYIEKESDL